MEHFDVVIVGGGLAGLSAGAYLSHHGKKVAILERGALGGRAVTLSIKGFAFNFGAHAIYGRDTSILTMMKRAFRRGGNFSKRLLMSSRMKLATRRLWKRINKRLRIYMISILPVGEKN